ncbi:hypothetical protein WQ54_19210 [Bacillus sp. SA1-12]|uniref:hypothetical protein n=1 Tax=Bacillus sp. SA1-12 TaxID=1455638 RepID=UPI0006272C80|nr:hypothetical protein [Bacillus sp. SA1-12]KKI90732.1 hypothetical protein WQ54_19210 [Bacillus sp. SA1-12]
MNDPNLTIDMAVSLHDMLVSIGIKQLLILKKVLKPFKNTTFHLRIIFTLHKNGPFIEAGTD